MTDNIENKSSKSAGEELNFDEFPRPDYQTWREEVEKTLRGTSFEKKMTAETYDDIILQPMYWPDDIRGLPSADSFPGFGPYSRGRSALGRTLKPWLVAQEIIFPLAVDSNRNLLQELANGQNTIIVKLDRAGRSGTDADKAEISAIGADGTSISTLSDLVNFFNKVDITEFPVYLRPGNSGFPLAALYISYINKQTQKRERLQGCFGIDPLAELAISGEISWGIEQSYDETAALAKWSIANLPDYQILSIDSSAYRDSGANVVQELAFALGTAVEYMRSLERRGIAVEQIATRLMFAFAIGPEFFTEIAKLRAFRMLWYKVVESCGARQSGFTAKIHSRSSSYDKTCHDPHVNLLRATTEALSAILGGCDSLEIGSFDSIYKSPDSFSIHLARNIQLILREESHTDKIIDPAGGSWYIEKLTAQIADKAWALFQEIESAGGMLTALINGLPQKLIEDTAAKREKNIAKRKDVIVGTNMYANPGEKPLPRNDIDHNKIVSQRLTDLKQHKASMDAKKKSVALGKLSAELSIENAIEAADCGAKLGEIAAALHQQANGKTEIEPLRMHRAAEMFESIRNSIEVFRNKTGSSPQVFLANVGGLSEYKARADFASGFFEVGGFAVINGKGYKSPPDAAEAAIGSQAAITVICSSDDNYTSIVEPLAQAIKKVKPEMIIVLAGRPKDWESYRKAGVDEFIYLGCDARELLEKFARQTGVIS